METNMHTNFKEPMSTSVSFEVLISSADRKTKAVDSVIFTIRQFEIFAIAENTEISDCKNGRKFDH